VKFRLAERFGIWPMPDPPHKLTAPQAMLLAEALRDARMEPGRPSASVRRQAPQPKLPRRYLEEFVRKKHGDDVRT